MTTWCPRSCTSAGLTPTSCCSHSSTSTRSRALIWRPRRLNLSASHGIPDLLTDSVAWCLMEQRFGGGAAAAAHRQALLLAAVGEGVPQVVGQVGLRVRRLARRPRRAQAVAIVPHPESPPHSLRLTAPAAGCAIARARFKLVRALSLLPAGGRCSNLITTDINAE